MSERYRERHECNECNEFCRRGRNDFETIRDMQAGLNNISVGLRDIEKRRICEGIRDIEEGIRDIREGLQDICETLEEVFKY